MQTELTYEQRIRRGLIPWRRAEAIIAEHARFVRFDAWQLNVDPIDHPLLKKMGIRQPIDIRHKFLHVFPTLLDADGNALMAIHTMPVDIGNPHCPGAMGGKSSKIRIFAMTPDASDARHSADQHKSLPATAKLPIRHPAERAKLIRHFVDNITSLNHAYTVPVQPVRDQFVKALTDTQTLCPRLLGRQSDRVRRRFALRQLAQCSNETLANELAKQSEYPLGADGFNSNSGADALREILDYPSLPYSDQDAPFIDRPMLALQEDLRADLKRVNALPEPQTKQTPVVTPITPQRGLLGRFLNGARTFAANARLGLVPA